MKKVTLHIPDNKYPFFVELAQSLDFVKKIEIRENSSKQRISKKIRHAVKELNFAKTGKLKARDARDLINEL